MITVCELVKTILKFSIEFAQQHILDREFLNFNTFSAH